MKKKVAAVVTVYHHWSHADILIGKIMEGYNHDGGAGPDLTLAALYVDQFPANDMARALAKKHGVRLSPTVTDAVTLGGTRLAVDGVIIVGEHGNYPTNDRGQILYPRRKFFAEVADVFARSGRSVPVFNDKHLSARWDDAKWVYDRARELHVPFLAGSSLPVAWRKPQLALPRGCALTAAASLGYGPLDGYGFHSLEGLQCMAERRKGGETGVKAVQHFRGDAMWELLDSDWASPLTEAIIKQVTNHARGDVRQLTRKHDTSGAWLIEYNDGFRGLVPVFNSWVHECDGGDFFFAGTLAGKAEPVVTQFYMQQPDPYAHFAELLKAIDRMVQTQHPPYPVERTLLTSGILDAIMTSRAEGDRRVETPHLAIRYEPTDWPFATGPVPKAIKR
jgi:hypothetical protein